jgi:DNA polymerase II large subunit
MITKTNLKKKHYTTFVVYKITNPNGYSYIGATSDLERRIKTYKTEPSVYKNQTTLFNSVIKYGWDKHTIEVILKVDKALSIVEMRDIEMANILLLYYTDPAKCLNSVIKGVDNRHEERQIKINKL